MKTIFFPLKILILLTIAPFFWCNTYLFTYKANVFTSSSANNSTQTISTSALQAADEDPVVTYALIQNTTQPDSKTQKNLTGALQMADEDPVVTYALIEAELTLYSDSLLTRVICSLPASYFVIVLEDSTLYTHVSYFDLTGYVHASGIKVVDYEPVTKFATTFEYHVNNDGYPASLRSQPDHKSDNKLKELPNGTSGTYYGTALGSTMIAEVGNLWYYVSYEDGSGKTHGYVYKSQLQVDEITPNIIEKVQKTPAKTAPKSPFEFDDNYSLLIILALTLPAALITLLIFKKPKKSPRYDKPE